MLRTVLESCWFISMLLLLCLAVSSHPFLSSEARKNPHQQSKTASYLCFFLLTLLCFILIKPAFVITAYTETCALAVASIFAVLLKVFYFWFFVWE